jgi:hypothetical protein
VLKFTPPLTTEHGLRWKNLLVVESLCAQTLAAQGIAAVGASPQTFQVLPGGLRAGLLLPRFDRTGLLGRRGASTLYWLSLSRGQFELDAPPVMRSLADEGLVSRADADAVRRSSEGSGEPVARDRHGPPRIVHASLCLRERPLKRRTEHTRLMQ